MIQNYLKIIDQLKEEILSWTDEVNLTLMIFQNLNLELMII